MVLCNLPYRLREIAGRIAKKCRRRKDRSLEAKLEDIRNLLIYNHPISSVPPATGKLRLLQDGNTVLLALFARRCRENGLRYWLDYGTLLGAVRHRGFIPWDDDADVWMPREDYDRFLDYCQKNKDSIAPYKLSNRQTEENYYFGISRFSDRRYKYIHTNNEKPIDIGVFVDVYPLDFYGENVAQAKKILKHIQKENRKIK